MPKKPKPHADRKLEDYLEADENALQMAKAIAGDSVISGQDFLEGIARSPVLDGGLKR
jgi:hypothetical protein